MNKPWFKRFAGFSYMPISWHGWVASAIMLSLAAPFAALSMIFLDTHPVLGWVCGVAFVTIAACYFALVVWKLERNYGS